MHKFEKIQVGNIRYFIWPSNYQKIETNLEQNQDNTVDKILLERFEKEIWNKIPHLENNEEGAKIVNATPLAEVYDKMFSTLQAKRPNIFLTLTDGEPSDSNAVRKMTKSLKGLGITMVALGLGVNTVRATTIANNLKHLGYDKTMAVSRLKDIPNKVINLLDV